MRTMTPRAMPNRGAVATASARAKLAALGALATIAAALVAVFFVAPQSALALPPDGPSPNTPGTYVEVWPTTVQAGDVLNFRVSGFPAGEIIHLKYDDGDASVCGSSAVHGACVIHTQVVPSSGVTVGSIVIPSDLPAGTHWLRFLASAPAPGGGGGVLGYSLHGQGGGYGNSNFTVVAGGTGGQGAASGSAGAPSGAAAPGQTSGVAGSADATTGAGATAKAVVGDVATTEPQEVPAAPVASGEKLPASEKGGVEAAVDDGNLTLAVSTEFANEWTYVYAYGAVGSVGLGWQQVANDGTLRLSILDLEAGDHRFAVLDEDGELMGWVGATIDADLVAQAQELATGVAPGASEASESAGGGIPWLGIGAVAFAAVAAGAILWLVLRRPKIASGTPAAGAAAAEPAHGPDER